MSASYSSFAKLVLLFPESVVQSSRKFIAST
jgi:hypothetical protein